MKEGVHVLDGLGAVTDGEGIDETLDGIGVQIADLYRADFLIILFQTGAIAANGGRGQDVGLVINVLFDSLMDGEFAFRLFLAGDVILRGQVFSFALGIGGEGLIIRGSIRLFANIDTDAPTAGREFSCGCHDVSPLSVLFQVPLFSLFASIFTNGWFRPLFDNPIIQATHGKARRWRRKRWADGL